MKQYSLRKTLPLLLYVLLSMPFCAVARFVPWNVQDSLVLVDLYQKTGGANWVWTWDLSMPVSTWRGVSADVHNDAVDEYRVGALAIYNNHLTGEIPASLGRLAKMTSLDLSANSLTGAIPESLGQLNLLQVLELNNNNLTGPLPSSIGNIPALGILYLSYNQIDGPVPASWVNLVSLVYLHLEHNALTLDGMEAICTTLTNTFISCDNQKPPIIHVLKDVLSVNAGGTLSNNVYTWKRRGYSDIHEFRGDSTFTPSEHGLYYVSVRNDLVAGRNIPVSEDLVFNKIRLFKNYPVLGDHRNDTTLGNLLGVTSSNIKGVAADGATKIFLTLGLSTPATFYLTDPADGSFSSIQNQHSSDTTITVTPLNDEVSFIYNAPDSYGAGYPKGGRKIIIYARDASGELDTTQLALVPPPVVLVHGMWSNPDVWTDGGFIKMLKDSGITEVFRADYADYSSKTYDINDPESIYGRLAVRSAVNRALTHYLIDDSIGATQVDIIAHSLGGLMSRSYSQESTFLNNNNYYKGSIHKLITLNTPHRGTPLGPVLWNARQKVIFIKKPDISASVPSLLSLAASLIEMPIGSVHRDFGIESSGVKSLTQTPPYKTFSIAGDFFPLGLVDFLALSKITSILVDRSLFSIYATRCDSTTITSSDVIVPVYSQKGYVSKNRTFNVIHSAITHLGLSSTVTNDATVQQSVISLLQSSDSSMFNKGFPAPSAQPLDCNTTGLRTISDGASDTLQKVMAAEQDKFVSITSPGRGKVYNSGVQNAISLSFVLGGGMVLDSAFFDIANTAMVALPPGATSSSFTLPAGISPGNLRITVMAKDKDGTVFADTSHIYMDMGTAPDSLGIDSTTIMLGNQARTYTANVFGYYHSGDSVYTKRLNDHAGGAVYALKKGQLVATVSSNGLLTAVAAGADTLLVTLGSFKDSVAVVVAADFFVGRYSNSIDFPVIPDQPLTSQLIPLEATVLSGDFPTFEVSSGPAIVTNGVMQLTGTGQVTITASSPGNAYFAAANNASRTFNVTTALPVSLTNFVAARTGPAQVMLNWQTFIESHNKGFAVERTVDPVAGFTRMAWMPSLALGGNSNSPLLYRYADSNSINVTTYYRLRQEDVDGKITYSDIRSVAGNNAIARDIRVWPNPSADGQVWITIPANNGVTLKAMLYDALGREIRKMTLVAGKNNKLEGLRSGIYWIYVAGLQGNGGMESYTKIIVQ